MLPAADGMHLWQRLNIAKCQSARSAIQHACNTIKHACNTTPGTGAPPEHLVKGGHPRAASACSTGALLRALSPQAAARGQRPPKECRLPSLQGRWMSSTVGQALSEGTSTYQLKLHTPDGGL